MRRWLKWLKSISASLTNCLFELFSIDLSLNKRQEACYAVENKVMLRVPKRQVIYGALLDVVHFPVYDISAKAILSHGNAKPHQKVTLTQRAHG